MNDLDIVRQRLATQRLTGTGYGSPAEVVRRFGAVQAQEFAEVKWSLAERIECEPGDAAVERAFTAGEIIRTHVLRPTWHFVAREDLRWILKLTAPRVRQATRYYFRLHGLDDAKLERTTEMLSEALREAGEPQTRRELQVALSARGVEADGPGLGHIMMFAELEATICSGPRRGKQHTYVLVDELLPPEPERNREDALAELTRRYFLSHGPATPRDFSWWSGLTLADARAAAEALGDELTGEVREDGTVWYGPPDPPEPEVRSGAHLIPMYDELGVAYKDLRGVYAAQPPDGLMARPILIDGVCVGSWRRVLGSKAVTLEATLFTELSRSKRSALETTAERFGRFLELPVRLVTASARR